MKPGLCNFMLIGAIPEMVQPKDGRKVLPHQRILRADVSG